jgi:undecaprenyl-diphosphatase
MNYFDLNFISFLNQYSQASSIVNELINAFASNELLTIAPIIALLWWYWFKNNDQERRNRKVVISTILGCILTGLIFFALQDIGLLFKHRLMPVCNKAISFQIPVGINPQIYKQCVHTSFPSGHAALLFSISFGIAYISRLMGGLCLIYSLIICFPRIYLGIHYPSDIIGGAFLGAGFVYLANLNFIRNSFTQQILKWSDYHPSSFYAVFFLISTEIAAYCANAGAIAKVFLKLLKLLL